MMQVAGILVAVILGLAVGWCARRIPVWPVAQDIGATIIAWFLGTVVAMASVLLEPFPIPEGHGGIGAVSIGLSEPILLGVPSALLLAVAGGFVLRRVGKQRPALLATHTAIVLGGFGALVGALLVARTVVVSFG